MVPSREHVAMLPKCYIFPLDLRVHAVPMLLRDDASDRVLVTSEIKQSLMRKIRRSALQNHTNLDRGLRFSKMVRRST